MKSLIPKSKAKTAYGLLSEICALTLAEPKRMVMSVWKVHGQAIEDQGLSRPACNTVGCVGGWTEILHPKRKARFTLGLDQMQQDELFTPSWWYLDNSGGTPKHARKVIAHIRRFQKKYSTQLRSKSV